MTDTVTELPTLPNTPSEGVADPPRTETERIDPDPKPVTLTDGTEIDIQPLKLRQFLRFLKIVTRGGSAVMHVVDWTLDIGSQEFIQQVMVMLLFAVPEAEEETIQFVKSMVAPKALLTEKSPTAQRANADRIVALQEYLDNPELEDLVTVLEAIVTREASDLVALGKRLRAMVAVAEKMGVLPKSDDESPSTETSSVESAPVSTS